MVLTPLELLSMIELFKAAEMQKTERTTSDMGPLKEVLRDAG